MTENREKIWHYQNKYVISPRNKVILKIKITADSKKQDALSFENKKLHSGMSIEQALDQDYLSQHIVGPWIFVDASLTDKYDFYILTKHEVIDLLYQAHDWYWNHYHRTKDISPKSPAGFKLKWLQGLSKESTNYHDSFSNPILSAKDRWDKIK